MDITEVKVRLVEDLPHTNDRLLAFASVVFDHCFVIHDLKVIDGPRGLFLSMPCRKRTDHCQQCGYKNNVTARYCGGCGKRLQDDRAPLNDKGLPILVMDVCHPLDNKFRDKMKDAVIQWYEVELAGVEARFKNDSDLLVSGRMGK